MSTIPAKEDLYRCCRLCPRSCGINRYISTGFCHCGADILAARAALHFWEEPCISGPQGSGAVFFSGCNLSCLFCQNVEISRGRAGKTLTIPRLSEIFLSLQKQGAHNLNLITAGHFAPSVAEALLLSRENGLTIPVVYNSSGYETVETLSYFSGLVDIFLPDLKTLSPEVGKAYMNAPDYPEVATKAILYMMEQTGPPVFDETGLLQKGTMIRHLALPTHHADSEAVLLWISEHAKGRALFSLMNQYTPMPQVASHPVLSRHLSPYAYRHLVELALSLGLLDGYIQEGATASESFIPPFDYEGL